MPATILGNGDDTCLRRFTPKWSTLALLAATTLLASGAFAAADIPGGKGTKAVLTTGPAGVEGTFEKKGDSDWYKVRLKGGQNYALSPSLTDNSNCLTLNLRNANGKILGSATSDSGADDGFEFQPEKAGTYFVEFLDKVDSGGCTSPFPYPLPYRGDVTADARGDVMTEATAT